MKKKFNPLAVVITGIISIFLFIFLFPVFNTQAGQLGDTYIYLSRIQEDLDGVTDPVEMILVFETSQAFSGGSISIDIFFPLGEDNEDVGQWCRNEGDLSVEAVDDDDIPPEQGTVAVLPGATLSAECFEGTANDVGDSITITGIGNLAADGVYGVKLERGGVGEGIIGTSPEPGSKTVVIQLQDANNMDAKAISLYIIPVDTVEVQVVVEDAPTVICTLDTDTVTIPALFPGGIAESVTITDQIETTSPAGGGYYWAAYGQGDGSTAGLYNNVDPFYLIESSSTTVDLTPGNSEGFGINITPTGGGQVPSNFQAGTTGRYGGIVYGPDGARLILYNNNAVEDETASVTYGARASSSALGGTYREFITYVCGGYY